MDRDGALRRQPASGGQSELVARLTAPLRGAAWLDDDTIVFATNDPATGLLRVASTDGAPTVLTTPDAAAEGDHLWPSAVAGRAAVLYTVAPGSGASDGPSIRLLDLGTGVSTLVVRGASDGRYLSAGYLVHTAATSTIRSTLYVRRLDLARPQDAGPPVEVAEGVTAAAGLSANFDVADNGMLVYSLLSTAGAAGGSTLAWVDEQGDETPLEAPPRAYLYPRISPDGQRIALDVRDQESDIWIWDVVGRTLSRLTTDPATDRFPAWTPDSRAVIVTSDRDGPSNVYRQSVTATTRAERLSTSPNTHSVSSVAPDGTAVIIRESAPQFDLMRLTLAGGGALEPIVKTPFLEQNGEISPDGRWFAYEANESGTFQVYVRPYPGVEGGRWQVSRDGGTQPLWSRDGKALFFGSSRSELMRADVVHGPEWLTAPARRLFALSPSPPAIGGVARTFDQAPDGRFVVVKSGGFTQPRLVLVANWLNDIGSR